MLLSEIKERALEERSHLDSVSIAAGTKVWGVREHIMGMVKDVGKLQGAVLSLEGYGYDKNPKKLAAGELADILYSVFVISDELGVDLEKAFVETMDDIKERCDYWIAQSELKKTKK